VEENLRDRLARLLERFGELRVAVVGDVMLDSYLHGAAGRICREAPVPVVTLEQRTDVPGGAANAAANVRALGAEVTLLAVIGDDSEGALLRQALGGCGVGDEQLIVAPGRATLVKHRVLADTQMLVRFDQGSTAAVDLAVERELIDRLAALFAESDAVIVSDYGYGVLTPRVIAAIAELQRRHRHVLVVDSKQLDAYREAGVTLAKPNYEEALALLGEGAARTVSRVETVAAHGELLRARTGAQCVAVTLDLDGALLFSGEAPPYRTFAQRTSGAHPAGAGDTFISAMALALASGAELPLAAELAAAASAVVVASAGTVACGQGALLAYLGGRAGHRRSPGARRAGRAAPAAGQADRLHQRLLRHPPPRPYHLPQPRQGAGRRADRRRELGREHPAPEGERPADQHPGGPHAGARGAQLHRPPGGLRR
jgi:D-beta-D-heptose 7-phosphate kinase / D-beta-D-heptose 1-phosphate adenosyltransferase